MKMTIRTAVQTTKKENKTIKMLKIISTKKI